MNEVGTKTLEYLRNEKDLFEERKWLADVKKKVENSNLFYWLTGANKRRVERSWQVVSILQENSRTSLVEMSGRLKIPVSTLFDTLKEVEKSFHFTIVLKDDERNVLLRDTIPVEFAHEVLIETNEEKITSKPLNVKNIWEKYSPCGDSSVPSTDSIQNSQTSSPEQEEVFQH